MRAMDLSSSVPAQTRSVRQRLKAAAVHLAVTAAIFACGAGLIVFHWYPGFHFGADGGWKSVRLLALAVLPWAALTFVIWNPLKPRRLLALDLGLIAAAQFATLTGAVFVIHGQHPVAVSYHEGMFYPVTVAPLRIESYELSQLATLSDRRPALVYVMEPANSDEADRFVMQLMLGKVMPHEDPLFFRPFAAHWNDIRSHAVAPTLRAAEVPAFGAALPAFLEARGARADEFLYFPYEGRYRACTLAFTRGGALLDAVGCEPA
jgi:hypothetical protein